MTADAPRSLVLTEEELDAIEQLSLRLADRDGHRNRVSSLRRAIAQQDTKAVAALLDEGMGLHGPLYPLFLVKECLGEVERLYQKLGIPDAVRDATLFDIRRWVDEHRARSSGGLGLSQVYWIARHLCARILQLGSLQYEPKGFGYPFRLYGHAHGLTVLAEAGLLCSEEGYRCTDGDGSFTTRLHEDGGTLIAHTVDRQSGSISKEPTSFLLSELTLLCDSSSGVINIHIPKAAALDRASVDASLAQARAFFADHPIMVCTSWLLDPALASVLDDGSNIVRFMDRFCKFPVPFSVPQIYERVFGHGYGQAEVLAFPASTSLQRRVQKAIIEGVVFRTMGGYIAPPREL